MQLKKSPKQNQNQQHSVRALSELKGPNDWAASPAVSTYTPGQRAQQLYLSLGLGLQSWPKACCKEHWFSPQPEVCWTTDLLPSFTSGERCHDGLPWQSLELIRTGRLTSLAWPQTCPHHHTLAWGTGAWDEFGPQTPGLPYLPPSGTVRPGPTMISP